MEVKLCSKDRIWILSFRIVAQLNVCKFQSLYYLVINQIMGIIKGGKGHCMNLKEQLCCFPEDEALSEARVIFAVSR